MAAYTKQSYDFVDLKILNFLHEDLHLDCVGLGLGRVPPGKGYPFWHTHEKQEEVYICLEGSLTLLVDDDELTLHAGDFVRVAPEAKRTVGNRTNQPGTILIAGAMPFDGYSPEAGRSRIRDGNRVEGEEPDWTVAT